MNEVLSNSIRRCMLLHVPALAVHVVEFFENTTTFPDAFLAHRLAMVTVQPKSLEAVKSLALPDACVCDGKKCSKCSIVGNIHVTASKDAVRWSDIQLESKTTMAAILHGEQVLCALAAGKELKCRVWIMRGTHYQHAKWAVATTVASPTVYESVGTLSRRDIYRGALEALIERLSSLLLVRRKN